MIYSSHASPIASSPSPASQSDIESFKKSFSLRYAEEKEFLQAHTEIMDALLPVFNRDSKYFEIFKILSEPERIISFRVLWNDDSGKLRMNRGYRVQYNSALGPYKGGLRLHSSVNLSVLKFLGFEQIFKNSLTGLALGGAKGGSDFDPKGKSDMEVRNFCQAFMTELSKHIGPNTDVPAGDIGTGGREIGFMYGQYRKITNSHSGVLTGKGISWGGSEIRPEATGYGAVYFAQNIFSHFEKTILEGKTCLVSGSGNAAQYTCQKLIQLGAKVLSVSDSDGTLLFPNGMNEEQLEQIMNHKNVVRGRLSELSVGSEYKPGVQPWGLVPAEIAFPSATQNELDVPEVHSLIQNNVKAVIEVSNMSTTNEAITLLKEHKVYYAPGKAANAGGVAVSGLEMSQNASMTQWSSDNVDHRLKCIMDSIFANCIAKAKDYVGNDADLQSGANIAGFLKVADAMIEQGLF